VLSHPPSWKTGLPQLLLQGGTTPVAPVQLRRANTSTASRRPEQLPCVYNFTRNAINRNLRRPWLVVCRPGGGIYIAARRRGCSIFTAPNVASVRVRST
jgi:hypothetical protein